MNKLAVLVTGAAGTLGSSTAKVLVSNGFKVTLMDLPNSNGSEIAAKLGDSAMFCPGDVTSEEDVVKALEETKSKFGGLKTLVNCASVHKAFEVFNFRRKIPMQLTHLEELLRVNVVGTVNVIRLAVQYMQENAMDQEETRGLVINTSGFAAYDGQKGQTGLAAAWGALGSMTLPLCREFGQYGIRVMTIAPGLMESNLTSFLSKNRVSGFEVLTPCPKRLGRSEEYGELVLAIIKNTFLNGEMFNQGGLGGTTFGLSGAKVGQTMSDFEVTSPPDDSVSSLRFSPATLPQNFLIAGSWDNSVRCWEVEQSGKTIPKSIQSMEGPILDVCWHDDGTKVFMASCDKQVKAWDLASNQTMQVAAHDAPVKTCHWVQGGSYSCLMTGSWDKTIKFWDTRTPNPMMTINLPERVYCADVDYPMAVVGTAGRTIILYQLDGKPQEFKRMESPLKYQHRCIAIFRDKKKQPAGFGLGSIEGRVAIQYVNQPKENFAFKCHRVLNSGTKGYHDIYAVNDLKFHPVHNTLATVGSDGSMSFWDKDARTKLKPFDPLDQPIVACAFNHSGHIFAYAASYDWSKGHEYYNPAKKSQIFLRSVFDEMKPRPPPS